MRRDQSVVLKNTPYTAEQVAALTLGFRTECLTPTQKHVFAFMLHRVRETMYPPTVVEIMKRFGLKSYNAVKDYIRRFEAERLIIKTPFGMRILGTKISVEHVLDEGHQMDLPELADLDLPAFEADLRRRKRRLFR